MRFGSLRRSIPLLPLILLLGHNSWISSRHYSKYQTLLSDWTIHYENIPWWVNCYQKHFSIFSVYGDSGEAFTVNLATISEKWNMSEFPVVHGSRQNWTWVCLNLVLWSLELVPHLANLPQFPSQNLIHQSLYHLSEASFWRRGVGVEMPSIVHYVGSSRCRYLYRDPGRDSKSFGVTPSWSLQFRGAPHPKSGLLQVGDSNLEKAPPIISQIV